MSQKTFGLLRSIINSVLTIIYDLTRSLSYKTLTNIDRIITVNLKILEYVFMHQIRFIEYILIFIFNYIKPCLTIRRVS